MFYLSVEVVQVQDSHVSVGLGGDLFDVWVYFQREWETLGKENCFLSLFDFVFGAELFVFGAGASCLIFCPCKLPGFLKVAKDHTIKFR